MQMAKANYGKMTLPAQVGLDVSGHRLDIVRFLMICMLLLTVVSIFHVWSRFRVVELNLQLSDATKQMKALEQEQLRLSLEARTGAVAHVTSQAATVAHRTQGQRIDPRTHLDIRPGATLAYTTDPCILFPDCALTTETEIVLNPGGRGLIAEGFATHDPAGESRVFARLETSSRVYAPDRRLLVQDRAVFTGADFGRPGALGGFAAIGSALLLGGEVNHGEVEARLDRVGVLAGASPLPNGAGCGVRMLASDGGRLSRGLEILFALAFAALTGAAPGPRPK